MLHKISTKQIPGDKSWFSSRDPGPFFVDAIVSYKEEAKGVSVLISFWGKGSYSLKKLKWFTNPIDAQNQYDTWIRYVNNIGFASQKSLMQVGFAYY